MKAILPVLERDSAHPYYMQLYQYLKEAITCGDIEAGERLPSLRALAKSTALSVTTVEKAYDQLLVEGYIYSRAQSGYYAGQVGSLPQTVPSENSFFDPKLSETVPAAAGRGLSQADGPAWLYDPDCFDFNKWKKCMNRILNEYSPALFFESSPQGEPALRAEIARYLYRARGVSCLPDQIVIGAGTQQITGHLAGILRQLQVEHVAMEDPAYLPVRNAFRDRGFAITDVKVDTDGLALEKLPANIRAAVYVSPSNHAFTGSVMPIGRRYELIRWAMDNDSYIIEDDYDSELRYFGRPIPALKSLTGADRVIYLGSFSSTLFAAVRISFMVLPPGIAADFVPRLTGYSQTCSKLEQLTLAMFMETGLYQTHLRKLRKLYALKLAKVTEAFRTRGADLVRVRSSSSGITVLLEVLGAEEGGAAAPGHPKSLLQLQKDAQSLGIPVSLSHSRASAGLLLLYYNQIPLDQMGSCIDRLLQLWRS